MSALAGRRVVITRADGQAGATAAAVREWGGEPVVVPLIEIVDEPAAIAELEAIDLDGFDWVVVTSPNGAERIARRLAGAVRPRVAAVGSATAAALPRCDLVARDQSAAGLLEVFPDEPGRVLVVQATGAAATMVDGLRARAADVIVVNAYTTRAAVVADSARDAALRADALLLASGSAARAWVEAFGDDAPPVVVAIGDQTAAVAQQAGLKITVVAADHSVQGMLHALGEYFSVAN